ncbi:GATA zinc finger domain-containing protein 14-like isoform X1 [Trichogramma pretiosum]|uniref:GATA zinc finger domain-containing protein 14-like isoform X1 n=1 Tax=Trichogramma pretiosum TaxID=7493 RepID=UPI0006C9C33E|nr:GATA zinc finger domain-containing protein 14-like isoform X1 [Trichogramma pretiosum]
MSRRRSQNRRSSARLSIPTGVLNDNTENYDDVSKDLLWYNESLVRPSTSFTRSRKSHTILDADTTASTAVSTNWYNNLTKSDSTKLLEATVQKNVPMKNNDAQSSAESEDDLRPSQKRKAKFGKKRNKKYKVDESNIFHKAFEKTTDSVTKNLSHAVTIEGNKDDNSHQVSNTNIPKRRSIKIISDKLLKKASNKTSHIEDANLSAKVLRNRSISNSPSKTLKRKLSLINQESDRDDTLNNSASIIKKPKHKRRVLFSKNKNKSETNVFDAILDSTGYDSISESISKNNASGGDDQLNEKSSAANISVPEKADIEDDIPSDSSSIPKNIRRSVFIKKKSGDLSKNRVSDISTKSKFELSQKSQNKSGKIEDSDEKKENVENTALRSTNLLESSDDENIYDKSHTSQNSENVKDQSVKSKTTDSSVSSKIASKLNMSKNKSKSRVKNSMDASQMSKKSTSSIQTNDKESSLNQSKSRVEANNISYVSNRSKNSEGPRFTNQTLNNDFAVPSPVISQSSQPFKNKNYSSKNKTLDTYENVILEGNNYQTPSSSQRNPTQNDSISSTLSLRRSQPIGTSTVDRNAKPKRKPITESPKNISYNSKESEHEESTMPKHIRRTKSNLFQKNNSNEENSIFDKGNESFVPEKQNPNTSIISNTSKRSNTSTLRDACFQKQMLNIPSKEPLDYVKHTTKKVLEMNENSSNDSLKENQQNDHSSIKLKLSEASFEKRKSKSASSQVNEEQKKNNSDNSSVKKSNEFLDKDPSDVSIEGSSRSNRDSNAKVSSDVSLENSNRSKSSKESRLENSKEKSTRKNSVSKDKTPNSKQLDTNRVSMLERVSSKISDDFNDDVLLTPHPAQSTLNPHGRPVSRITQFSLGKTLLAETITPNKITKLKGGGYTKTAEYEAVPEDDEDESDLDDSIGDKSKINETQESNDSVNDQQLLSRHPDDIPEDNDLSQEEDMTPFLSEQQSKQTLNNSNQSPSTIPEEVWQNVKKKTDAFKLMMANRIQEERKVLREKEVKKARVDAKFKRTIAQQEAEKKKSQKKTPNEAYLVKGKLYKQPRLPRPQSWATDRLYKHLWQVLEPKFGLKTRVRSEEFVVELSNTAKFIKSKKKYEAYESELEELIQKMAELGIIEDRIDFYRWCRNYMPYSFRSKVIPMMLPGNIKSIPSFDPKTAYKPILGGSEEVEDDSDEDQEN